MAATYGVSRSTNSRIRNVGIESSEQDLTGDDVMIWQTSSFITGRKVDHDDVALSLTTGAGVADILYHATEVICKVRTH